MQLLLVIALLLVFALSAVLCLLIKRTNHTLRQARTKLNELKRIESYQRSIYCEKIPIMMAKNIQVDPKHKAVNMILYLN